MAVDEQVAEQLRDFKINQIQNTTSAELFSPADTEVSTALEGQGFKITKTQADKIVVYDKNGVPSTILKYMLSKKLQQGFTLEDPGNRIMGSILCYLHPESEEREWLDSIGLRGRTCDPQFGRHKSQIPTEWDRELHMKHKHKKEWETISRAEQRRERQEAMQFQRTQAEALERMAAAGGTPQKRST
jgi:hypothetical protein